MPHVIVKMYAGRTDSLKKEMVEKVAAAVRDGLKVDASTVSVSIEEYDPAEWLEKVFLPDIVEKPGGLWQKPGYDPREKK